MSVTITRKISPEKLTRILPKAYAEQSRRLRVRGTINLLVFDDSPVRSRQLLHALKRIEHDDENILCVGRDFTVEALELAERRHVQIIALTHFGWSDLRDEKTRVFIGSKVKKPDL